MDDTEFPRHAKWDPVEAANDYFLELFLEWAEASSESLRMYGERDDGTLSEVFHSDTLVASVDNQESFLQSIRTQQFRQVYLVDTEPDGLSIAIDAEDGIYEIEVWCELREVIPAIRANAFSPEQYLIRYFSRQGFKSLVAAGSSSLLTDSHSALEAKFVSDPPFLPGWSFELESVQRVLPESVVSLGDQILRVKDLEDVEADFNASPAGPPSMYAVSTDTVPVSVWVSGDDGSEVRDALLDLLRESGGFLFANAERIVRGSWWQQLKVAVIKAYRSDFAREHYAELERRLELELVEKTSAEVNGTRADSAAKLIAAIEKQQSAVVIFGQIIIVKHDNKMVVRNIDAVTAGRIESERSLKCDPKAVLDFLSGVPLPRRPVPIISAADDEDEPYGQAGYM